MNKLLLTFFCINIASVAWAQTSKIWGFVTNERNSVTRKPVFRNAAKLYALASGANCTMELGTQQLQYAVRPNSILRYAKLGIVVVPMPYAAKSTRDGNQQAWADFIAQSLSGNFVETPYFDLYFADSVLVWAQTQQKLTQILPNSEPLPNEKAELRALLRQLKADLAVLTPKIRAEETSVWQNLNTSEKPELWQKLAQLDQKLYTQLADFEQNQNDKAAYAIADLTTQIQTEKQKIPAGEQDYLGIYEQWQAARSEYYRLMAQIAHIEQLLQNQK